MTSSAEQYKTELADAGVDPSEYLRMGRNYQRDHLEPIQRLIADVTGAIQEAAEEVPMSAAIPRVSETFMETSPGLYRASDYNLKGAMPSILSESLSGRMNGEQLVDEQAQTYDPIIHPGLNERYTHLTYQTSTQEAHAFFRWRRLVAIGVARRNVRISSVKDAIRPYNRPTGIDILVMPILNDEATTTQLSLATSHTLEYLDTLSDHSLVQEVLEKYKDERIPFARRKLDDRKKDEEMAKYAPMRMYTEAVMTTAQTIAMLIGDAREPVHIPALGCSLMRSNSFEKIAKGMPAGVIGPFATRGLVPRGGLVEATDTGVKLSPKFDSALEKRMREQQRKFDLAFGALALDEKLVVSSDWLSKQHSEAVKLNVGSPFASFTDLGCPAVFRQNPGNTSPVNLAASLLFRSIMDLQ